METKIYAFDKVLLELDDIDYIHTDREITDIVDGLFNSQTNKKYYKFGKNGELLGMQNIEEYGLRIKILTLFLEISNVKLRIKNCSTSLGEPPTYDEIKEMKVKCNELISLIAVASTLVNTKLKIPINVLTWLKNHICLNGMRFIEDANAYPLKWLQNKQLARELLTHDKIKDRLSDAEVKRQAQKLFLYKGKPLLLARNKTIPSKDSDELANFLATI